MTPLLKGMYNIFVFGNVHVQYVHSLQPSSFQEILLGAHENSKQTFAYLFMFFMFQHNSRLL